MEATAAEDSELRDQILAGGEAEADAHLAARGFKLRYSTAVLAQVPLFDRADPRLMSHGGFLLLFLFLLAEERPVPALSGGRRLCRCAAE